MERKNDNIKWREAGYLNSWLNRQSLVVLRKDHNNINSIIDRYELELSQHPYTFNNYFTSAERYKFVNDFLHYHINIKPSYKKLLKAAGLTSAKVGYLMGYKTDVSWRTATRQRKYITAIVTIHELAINNQFNK